MKNKDIERELDHYATNDYVANEDTRVQLDAAILRLKGTCKCLHMKTHLFGKVCNDCGVIMRKFTKAFDELG